MSNSGKTEKSSLNPTIGKSWKPSLTFQGKRIDIDTEYFTEVHHFNYSLWAQLFLNATDAQTESRGEVATDKVTTGEANTIKLGDITTQCTTPIAPLRADLI